MPADANRPGEVDIVAHPPERRRRSTTLAAAGCCCCCCCCVHTFGGVAGAILGARRKGVPLPETLTTEAAIREEAEKKQAQRYAIKTYWLSVTIVALLTCIVCMAVDPREAFWGPLIVAGFLPAGQLLASLLALLYIHFVPPARREDSMKRIKRMTLFAFLGALLGCLGTALSFFFIIKS
jgi:hypothetical protein